MSQLMMPISKKTHVLNLFADLLSYPREDYKQIAEQCYTSVTGQIKSKLSMFMEYVQEHSLDELQMNYTSIFELNFHIAPYVGYYLFGESYLRSMFLVELSSRFKKNGYYIDKELPDHLAVILKFIALNPTSQLSEELTESALIPALRRIIWSQTKLEDRPTDVSATLAYYILLECLLEYLINKPQEKVLQLTVIDSEIEDKSGIDQWITKKKNKEVK